jgi:hypothetical protein
MTMLGYCKSQVDPCMMMKGGNDDLLMVVIVHVDDCYVIGNEKSLKKLVVQNKEHGLLVKVKHETKDYLGCEILIWLGRPFIVKKMLNCFKDFINTLTNFSTRGQYKIWCGCQY